MTRGVIVGVIAASMVSGVAGPARAETPTSSSKQPAQEVAPKTQPAEEVAPKKPVAPTDDAVPNKESATDDAVPTYVWIAGAVGLVASGVAIGFALDASAAVDELEAACPAPSSEDALSGRVDRICANHTRFEIEDLDGRRQRSMTFAIGFSALGVGAIAAAIYGVVTAGEEEDASAVVVPMVGPDHGGLLLRARF